MANSIQTTKALFTASITLAITLALSCSSDIDPPPPPQENNISSSSSLSSGKALCLFSGGCSAIASEDCPAIGGQIVDSCPAASSSSSLPANMVLCLFNGSCNAVSTETCSAIGGRVVESCPAVSSSSIAPSSSSSLSANTVLCLFNGSCNAVSTETCSAIGGQAVQSCPTASSSSITQSSGGLQVSSSSLQSSSSSTPSSSSVTPITPSSSGIAQSSSALSGTSGTFTDSRDGKVYKWVKIGEQTWIAENLNYNVNDSKCYDNKESNCATYGRLYNWATAMGLDITCNWDNRCDWLVQTKHKGICPQGWHIPSDADWNTLVKFVNPNCSDNSSCEGAGTKLKATSGWDTGSGYIAGTDNYGFSALPGGSGDGRFYYVGFSGNWWSATENNAYGAYIRYMHYDSEGVYWIGLDKRELLSVRCLQD